MPLLTRKANTWAICSCVGLLLICLPMATQLAQGEDPSAEDVLQSSALANSEAQLAERFLRLELLAGRLAELSRATQPRRSRLLRELVAKSRERDIGGRFEVIVSALREESLGAAVERQSELQQELNQLLNLLLQENRDRQIQSQRKRILQYLAEVNKLIRLQRGLKARTDGGDDTEALGGEQERVAQTTGKLRKDIEANEGNQPQQPGEAPDEKKDQSSSGSDSDQKGDSPDQDSESQKSSNQPKAQQGSSENSQQEGQGNPSGSPQQGESGQSQSSRGNSQQQESPSDRATERLRRAQQRMQQAVEKLKKAKRNDSVEAQEKALRELQRAKAELEKILRQLREEEMERMLVLLDARVRRMLDAQNEVYQQTQQLESQRPNLPDHEVEIASARLQRKENEIARRRSSD